MRKEEIEPSSVTKAIFYSPNLRSGVSVAKSLGLDPETQLQDSLIASVGACGSAQTLLLLVAALENAKSGDKLLVAGYGEGVDAFHIGVISQIDQISGRKGVDGYLWSKRTLDTYQKYVMFRGLTSLAPEARLRVFEYSGATITWRLRSSILRLNGSRCNKCNSTVFPVQRICYVCRRRDDYIEVPLADHRGKIFTFSLDNLAGGVNPPVVKGVVESNEGETRIDCLMTDCDPKEIEVDLPVEMTFRRMHEGADMYNYYWKARPIRERNGLSSK